MAAAADKIYGTPERHDELYAWIEQHKPEYLRHFYPRRVDGAVGCLTNFTRAADIWIFENCPLSWVVERIAEQYGGRVAMLRMIQEEKAE